MGEILRPVANVQLRAVNGHWFPASMYIDSGADMTLIPADFGKLLGMHLSKNRSTLAGVSGSPLKVSLQSALIRIGASIQRSKVAVALRNNVPYLLGREGVFNAFKITFEEYRQLTTFQRAGRRTVLDLAGVLSDKEAAELRSTIREIGTKSRTRPDKIEKAHTRTHRVRMKLGPRNRLSDSFGAWKTSDEDAGRIFSDLRENWKMTTALIRGKTRNS